MNSNETNAASATADVAQNAAETVSSPNTAEALEKSILDLFGAAQSIEQRFANTTHRDDHDMRDILNAVVSGLCVALNEIRALKLR